MSRVSPAPALGLSDGQVCLSDVLKTAALEARDLAGMGNRFQGLVAELMAASQGAQGSERIVEAQGLDSMVQRLAALSSFLEALAPSLSPDWKVNPALASQNLTLDHSVRRFGRRAEDRIAAATKPGDVDLF